MLRKLNNLGIATKLLLLLVGLAGSTAVVGGAGYWALSRTNKAFDDIGTVRMPSTEHLLGIKASFRELKAAFRTLMNSGLDVTLRQRQYGIIAKAREHYQAAMTAYEALLQTPEERHAWQQFLTLVQQWRGDNVAFTDLTKRVEALDIGDTKGFLADMERFRGDHFRLALQLSQFLENGQALSNGDDHSGCRFSKWRASFKTTNADLLTLLHDIEEPHHAFHQGVAKVIELVKADKKTEARAMFDKQVEPSAERSLAALASMCQQAQAAADLTKQAEHQLLEVSRVRQLKAEEQLDVLIKNNSEASAAAIIQGESVAQRAKMLLVIASIGAVVAGLGLGVIISRSITAPIAATVAHLEEVAAGSLTREVPVEYTRRADEIGALARSLSNMLASLRKIVGELRGGSSSLAGASTELSATATQLANGAEETTNQSAQVAAAAEEMSTNMTTMAAATEQMSANVKTVSSAIEQLTASIGEMAQSAERAAGAASNAAQLVDASNTQIHDLGNAADQIGKVIEVIQDIAEQTNLLALNATIEAARAGDAGKGFAVVATEVKELAKQTANATEDIRQRIEGIQNSTNLAVNSMGGIGDVIGQVNELSRIIASAVEEQSVTTREIAKNMAESSTSAQTVAKGVAESATASQEIARIIVGVDQAAKQAVQGATQTQSSSHELSTVAEQLRSLVGHFRV